MPVQTEPRQPVVYDMMLLADSLLALRELLHVKPRDPRFCERQRTFVAACTTFRGLADYVAAHRRYPTDLIITEPPFNGTADTTFRTTLFFEISKYVSHVTEHRYKKDFQQPLSPDVIRHGKDLLTILKTLMDVHKPALINDAAHWYSVFEERYSRLMA